MIIDGKLLLTDTTSLGSASTDVVDLGATHDLGSGEPMYLFIKAHNASTGNSGSAIVTLYGNASSSTVGTSTVVMVTPSLTLTTDGAGVTTTEWVKSFPIPMQVAGTKVRYLQAAVALTTTTAQTWTMWVGTAPQQAPAP